MTMHFFTCSLIFLLTSLQIGRDLAIDIEINPKTYTKILHDEINITCTTNGGDEEVAKSIILMEIVKDHDRAIVLKHLGKQPSFPRGNENRFVASGHISSNVSQTSLSLTISSYKSSDAGTYSCVMYFLDTNGLIRKEKSSLNFTEDRLGAKSLKSVLKSILDTNKDLQHKVANQARQIADLSAKVSEQSRQIANTSHEAPRDCTCTAMNNTTEFKMDTLSKQINDLADKVGYTVAFSATNKKSHITTAGAQTLIFPDLQMQVGQGYNRTTGVFTAPRKGIYIFHLTVMEDTQCALDAFLMVNTKLVARLHAGEVDKYDQSSVSAVAELKPGDVVFSASDDTGCRIYFNLYSMFAGYLIQAL